MQSTILEPIVDSEGTLHTIAIVAPNLDILGGQGVQALELLHGLREQGKQVIFVAVNPRFPFILHWLRRVPVLRTLFNQLLYIPSLVKLRHADVVHIYSASYWSFLLAPVPALLAARLFGKRTVLNYHSGEAEDHLSNWGMLVHPWLRLAHEIVVPSRYLEEVFRKYGYPCRVIHNTVEVLNFNFRSRMPLRPHLISARNLEPHYRVDNTLKAFALLKESRRDAVLTVAGYGSEEARLRKMVSSLGLTGSVRFAGRVERMDMPALFDIADIFVNSATIDNQPISILEAFACGLNVVTTSVGDIPNMVKDGITGKLVPCNDPLAMANAVSELLANPEQSALMARLARKELDNYTWRHVSREWMDVYSE